MDIANANSDLTRSVLSSWRFGIAICIFVLASVAIRDLFGSKYPYPAFLLPLLILGFVVSKLERWHLVTLWSVSGVLFAELVAFILGFHGYIVVHDVTFTFGHYIIATSINLFSEIVLSAILATIGARITTIDYDEDGVMRSIDIKRALNLRLLMFIVALPLLIIVARSFEVEVILSLTNVETSVWSLMQSDLLGYFMMTPLLIGVAFTLVGAPNLSSSWRPKRLFYSIYVGLLILSCGFIAFKIVTITFPIVMAISTSLALIGMLTPTMQIAGRLLLLNYVALFFSLQYVQAEKIEVIIAVIVLSVGTYVIMVLRTISQFEMDRAKRKVVDLLSTAQSYLESGMNAYIIQDHEFKYVFVSREMTKMSGYNLENIPQPTDLYLNYSHTFNDQHRQRLIQAAVD